MFVIYEIEAFSVSNKTGCSRYLENREKQAEKTVTDKNSFTHYKDEEEDEECKCTYGIVRKGEEFIIRENKRSAKKCSQPLFSIAFRRFG